MFKFRNSNKKYKLTLQTGIILVTTIIVFLGLPNFGFSSSQSIESQLSQIQENAIKYLEKQYQETNKITTNLFEKNKKEQQSGIEINISLSLNSTQSEINQTYHCNLDLSDIVSFLYIYDTNFKNHRDYLSLTSNKEKRKKADPIRQELTTNGCLKLSKCMNTNSLNPSEQIKKCSDTILTSYQKYEQANNDQQAIQTANLGKNKYRNGKTEDSEFDLINDIQQIGKLLFSEFKEEPKILFYAPPNLNPQSTSKDNLNSPQNQPQINNAQYTSTPISKNTPSIQILSSKDQNPQQNINFGGLPTEDDEINHFIQSGVILSAKNENNETLFINQCLPPNTILQKQENTTSNQKIATLIQDQQKENQKNNIKNQQELNRSTSKILKITQPIITQHNGTNLSNIDLENPEKIEENSESCLQKCDTKNSKGKYILDFDERATCKLMCICGEYSSPALRNPNTPFLDAGALRLRFCTLPAKAIQVNTNSKIIYTIEEAIKEASNTVKSLSQDGKLTVREMKTEFLESNLQQSNLSKNSAIIVNISQKPPENTTTTQEKKMENEEIMHLLETNTNFGRNSFLVTGSPQQTNTQKTTSQTIINTPSINAPILYPGSTLLRNNQATLNSLLHKFIQENENLLSTLENKFKIINTSLETLNGKK